MGGGVIVGFKLLDGGVLVVGGGRIPAHRCLFF